MNSFDNIKYSKAFLNQVIIRTDFLEFIPNENLFNVDIEKAILQFFPRRGKDQIIRFNSINVIINASAQNTPNTTGEIVEGIKKEYISSDGQNKFFLTNKYFVFEINAYNSFEDTMKFIRPVLLAIFSKNTITSVRTGIRYINIYDSDKIKLQKNYFSSEVSAALYSKSSINDEFYLTRAMSLIEYAKDSLLLKFRCGTFNPDYPNKQIKNSFVLDYDCYIEETIDSMDEILKYIEKGHESIQILFENSITDSMRKVMNGE